MSQWRNFNVENRRVTLNQYSQVNNLWILAPQGLPVLGGFGKSPSGVFSSFTTLKPHLRSRDVILLSGVLREQAVAPDDVYEVLILGAAGLPRQATDGGVPTGGGATWMAPASGAVAATPLLEIVRQGWTIENVLFNPHTSSAAVRLTTAGGLDEAGQFTMRGCTVLGGGTGQIGLEDNGGSGFVQLIGNQFQLLTGTAILGLTTANAVPLSWMIKDNDFRQNTNDIRMSLSRGGIIQNRFFTPGSGATNKVIHTAFLSGQGAANLVSQNVFSNTAAGIANASGYNGSATDIWSNNYASDDVQFGIPA